MNPKHLWLSAASLLLVLLALLVVNLHQSAQRIQEFKSEAQPTEVLLQNPHDAAYRWLLCTQAPNTALSLKHNDAPSLYVSSSPDTASPATPYCQSSPPQNHLPQGEHRFTLSAHCTLTLVIYPPSSKWPALLFASLVFVVLLTTLILSQRCATSTPAQGRWCSYDAPLAFIIFLGLSYTSTLIINKTTLSDLPHDWPQFVANQCAIALAFAAIALIFGRLRFKGPLVCLGLAQSSKIPLQYAILTGVGLALFALIILLITGHQEQVSHLSFMLSLPTAISATAFFALIAPLSEEIFFRGLIQTALYPKDATKSSSPWLYAALPIIITTLLFLLLHSAQAQRNPYALIPIALMSLCSGIWRYRSESLHGSIAIHLAYNACLSIPAILMQY